MDLRRALATTIVVILLFLPVGLSGIQNAHALLGGGLGGAVRIIEDVSTTNVTNSIKNTLSNVLNGIIAEAQQSLTFKEFTLDPIAWNMSKQLQQQLTADTIAWVNSGDDGKPNFITNYSEHYENIADEVAAEFIFGEATDGLCSERASFEVQAALLRDYTEDIKGEKGLECSLDENGGNLSNGSQHPLNVVMETFTNCANDPLCARLSNRAELLNKIATRQENEKQVLDYTRGFKPQRVCRSATNANGSGVEECDLVTPPSLIPDSVSFQVAEMPGLQLLNTDEFNEIVSGFMSNLTNQALGSINGLMSLGGNEEFSNNSFGPNGNLSYIDALVQDDVANQQSFTNNPIESALRAELRYQDLQEEILDEVVSLENRLANADNELGSCFDLELDGDLVAAGSSAIRNLEISSTTLAILMVLNTQYENSEDGNVRNAVLTTFREYEAEGYFRTQFENQDLELSFINFEFAEMVDEFTSETDSEIRGCDADPDDFDDSPPGESNNDEGETNNDNAATSTDNGTGTTTDDGTASSSLLVS